MEVRLLHLLLDTHGAALYQNILCHTVLEFPDETPEKISEIVVRRLQKTLDVSKLMGDTNPVITSVTVEEITSAVEKAYESFAAAASSEFLSEAIRQAENIMNKTVNETDEILSQLKPDKKNMN